MNIQRHIFNSVKLLQHKFRQLLHLQLIFSTLNQAIMEIIL